MFRHLLKGVSGIPVRSREALPGAEPFEVFLLRVYRAFHSIVKSVQQEQLEQVAIITHGGFLLTLFEEVLGISEEIHHHVGAVNVVEYQPAQAMLTAFFCARHE